MLIQVERDRYSRRPSELVYVPNAGKWKTRMLESLSFTKKDREANEDYVFGAIMGGTFGTFAGIPTFITFAIPGYTPATLILGGITALCGSAVAPAVRRKMRTPRHNKALRKIANDRMQAVVLTGSGNYTSSSYAMQALLMTKVGDTLQKLFKSQAAQNKKQIIAQLTADESSDNLFLRLIPKLDEYVSNTAILDIELEKHRGKASTEDIAEAEAEIKRYAQEVAEELTEVIRIFNEGEQMQAKTAMQAASDNLRMTTRSFQIERGKLPFE